MTTCPACGGENPEGTAFCTHCGSSLSAGGPADAPSLTPPAYQPPTAGPAPSVANPFGVGMANPAPIAPSYQAYPQVPAQPIGNYNYPVVKPLKDRNVALLLEILPALFGFYGIGRLYAGDTTTGLILLIGGFVWDVIAGLIAFGTVFVGALCTVPISLAIIGVSAYLLNTYARNHPELFGQF